MVLSIMLLGILTIFILILEETLTSDLVSHSQNSTRYMSTSPSSSSVSVPSNGNVSPPSSNLLLENIESDAKKFCWQKEQFEIVQPCSKCSTFEINSKIHDICELTGLKESVKCAASGVVYRSCSQITPDEKRWFWIFQSLMLLFTILGSSFLKYRRSILERRIFRKYERSLAS